MAVGARRRLLVPTATPLLTALPAVFFSCSFFLGRKHLRRPQLHCQLADLAGELEWHLVVLIVHRRAGVDADIEGLIPREADGQLRVMEWLSTTLPSTVKVPLPPLPRPGPSYFQSNTSVCLPGASASLLCHLTRSSSIDSR